MTIHSTVCARERSTFGEYVVASISAALMFYGESGIGNAASGTAAANGDWSGCAARRVHIRREVLPLDYGWCYYQQPRCVMKQASKTGYCSRRE